MKIFAPAFTLLFGLSQKCTAAFPYVQRDTVHSFDTIPSSTNLLWTPCFDNFSCSRLQVPLDYSNKSTGTTSIAFIKLTGANATANSPSIILLPGGPGGSGVDFLLSSASLVSQVFERQYNIISFDPRGVNNSGPFLDCFSGKPEAREAFHRLHNTGIVNISSTLFEEQYYSSSIYGDWCNHAAETNFTHGFYVTTPSVARDLLTFIEAEAKSNGKPPEEAKIWAYGASYGTVTGATFASMFPDRVERMILDGVVDADLYYRNDYSAYVDQMDEAMAQFSVLCNAAGPSKCAFWGPTAKNITTRLDNIIKQMQNHPIPISNAQSQSLPVMVTYSDLKALFFGSIYYPILTFPTMAETLYQVERGNFSALAGLYSHTIPPADVTSIIECADAYRTNSIKNIQDWSNYVEKIAKKSKYIGDLAPISFDPLLCRTMQPKLPDSMVIQNTTIGTVHPTYFPIVFASNTIDPVTPLISAQKSSARFPGSVILLQEGIGHTIAETIPSDCYIKHVQEYYRGIVPKTNTKCPKQYIPFINGPV